jgi:hypothetical protein
MRRRDVPARHVLECGLSGRKRDGGWLPSGMYFGPIAPALVTSQIHAVLRMNYQKLTHTRITLTHGDCTACVLIVMKPTARDGASATLEAQ